jgi:hypothetical protein
MPCLYNPPAPCLHRPPPQACHVSSWDAAHRATHVHVTSNRDPGLRRRLRRVLMEDPEIAPRICQLASVFGYGEEVAKCAAAGLLPSAGNPADAR